MPAPRLGSADLSRHIPDRETYEHRLEALQLELLKIQQAYLRQGRPAVDCPQLFVTARAPYRPLLRSSNVASVVDKHLHRAGTAAPCRGAHAFRHGFASRMLGQGQSLKAIADVLGHRCLSTTFLYTKVDFKGLDEVAMDWPEERP